MKKGINELMMDTRQEVINLINKKLQEENIPPVCMLLIVEGIMEQLNNVTIQSIQQERERYMKDENEDEKEVK